MTTVPAEPRAAPSFVWLWGPVAIQMALIFMASSIPNLGALPGDMSDKTGHSIGYALLGGFLLRALAGARLRGVTWQRAAITVILATLYGVSDEFHQSFVPGRSPDVHDVFADCRGAVLAVTVIGGAALVHAWGILKRSR
ncbi:MAG: VanZ family protein [Acidobacteriota bacterium]